MVAFKLLTLIALGWYVQEITFELFPLMAHVDIPKMSGCDKLSSTKVA